MFKVSELYIEGFRGINQGLPLSLGDHVTLIVGPRGTGKTTVCQGIEYCLFGKIPLLSGPEFAREDGLASSYHRTGKVLLKMLLQDENGRILEIIREAERRKKTEFGSKKSKLSCKLMGTLIGEGEFSKLLGLSMEDYYVTSYLRQETLRDFINAKPEERGDYFSKLLGLEWHEALLTALDSAVKDVKQKTKIAEKRWSERSERRQRVLQLAEDLERDKEDILKDTGISTENLTIDYLVDLSRTIVEGVSNVAKTLNETFELELSERNLQEIYRFEEKARQETGRLRSIKETQILGLKDKRNKLNNLKLRYNELYPELGISSLEELGEAKSKLQADLETVEKDLETKRQQTNFIEKKRIAIEATTKTLEQIHSELHTIENQFGVKEIIEKRIKDLEKLINEKEIEREKYDAYDKLITDGLVYLEMSLSSLCPICVRPIDPLAIIENLKTKSQELKVKEITRLESEIKGARTGINEQKGLLSQITDWNRRAEELDHQLGRLRKEVETQLGKLTTEPILSFLTKEIENGEEVRESLEEKRTEVKDKLKEIEEVKKKFEELTTVEQQAQTMLSTKARGYDLINGLDEKIREIDGRNKEIAEIESDLSKIESSLKRFSRVIIFLTRESQIKKALGEIPSEEEVKELEGKYLKLVELEDTLADIFQATMNDRDAFLQRQLTKLETALGTYYAILKPHVHFDNLQIIHDAQGYWLKASSKTDPAYYTYVRPKFSTAQLNMVAISLFFSMAENVPHNFGFIVLDDPSQSLDNDGKKLLAKAIAQMSSKKQLLIATQDEIFANEIKAACIDPKVYEIKSWNQQRGPII